MYNSNIRRCRLCACEEKLVDFSDIFEDNSELKLELKISKLLPVVVMPWDPMPHTICPQCVDKLNSFNEFYDVTLRAEKFLKKFFPSAPRNEAENVEPIVQLMDGRLKLPAAAPEDLPLPGSEPQPEPEPGSADPEWSMDRFIVNRITDTDSVFTCRECFRTFTKDSAARAHTCARIEECGELEGMTSGEQRLPLKIRLFSASSGHFVCYLCQRPFEKKSQVAEHLKEHFAYRDQKPARKKGKKRSRYKTQKDGPLPKKVGLYVGRLGSEQSRLANLNSHPPSGSPRALDDPKKVTEVKEPGRTRKAPPPGEDKSEEVTVIVLGDEEDAQEKGDRTFSCVFCDKVFAGKQTLIRHQESHLQGYTDGSLRLLRMRGRPENAASGREPEGGGYVCRICTMVFTQKKTLTDHEKYHFVDLTNLG